MTAVPLKKLLETFRTEQSRGVLSPLACEQCGATNFPDHVHPDPIFGDPEKRLIHFTCLKCGFYQEEVV